MLSFSRVLFRADNELKHQMYQPHTVTRNKWTEIISFHFPRSVSPAFLKIQFRFVTKYISTKLVISISYSLEISHLGLNHAVVNAPL